MKNHDDPVEIVQTLVEAAGLTVQVQDKMVLSEGHAIVVLRAGFGHPVTPAMLNHAYRRFIQSGPSGVSPFHPASCPSWTCAAESSLTRRCFTRVPRQYSGWRTPGPLAAIR